MKSSYGLALLACTMLFAACVHSSEVQARQGGFFFAPFFAPWHDQYYRPAWRHRYYAPPRKRYYALPRKRKTVRSVRLTQPRKGQQAALVIPRAATPIHQPLGCDKARNILAEYGFKD